MYFTYLISEEGTVRMELQEMIDKIMASTNEDVKAALKVVINALYQEVLQTASTLPTAT